MLLTASTRYLVAHSIPRNRALIPTRVGLPTLKRSMATVKDSMPHIDRTAHEPRQAGTWDATLSRIEQVNSKIRLLRLSLEKDGPTPLRHLPGQYVDLRIPSLPSVGGFTITSPPQTSLPANPDPYIELAIQDSPSNPPAAYLWQPPQDIINAPMSFQVGGKFIYPPLTLGRAEIEAIDRAVFVAGGVGINPIMSMVSAMDVLGEGRIGGIPKEVKVLYSSRRSKDKEGKAEEVLFEERLRLIAEKWGKRKQEGKGVYEYTFFETSGKGEEKDVESGVRYRNRRISHEDLFEALGPEHGRKNIVVYICGHPNMTDEFVDLLRRASGMEEKRVLCEKWW